MNWKDISVNKWKEINEIINSIDNTNEELEEDIYRVLAVLNDLSIDDILNMDYDNVLRMAKDAVFLQKPPKHSKAKREYELNGKVYTLTMSMEGITTAQYIDFQQMAEHSAENLARFLSIILIPKGMRYNNGYDINEAVYDIGNYLPIGDALGISDFFLSLYCQSIRQLRRETVRKMKELERNSEMEKEEKERLMFILRRTMETMEKLDRLPKIL